MWKLKLLIFWLVFVIVRQSRVERISGDAIRASESTDANKVHRFTVTNVWNADLNGIMVRADRRIPGYTRNLQFHYFYDSFLNPLHVPLKPGESYTFDTGSDAADLQPMQLSVEAAIFADGNAIGDPVAIKSLWRRRAWLSNGFKEIFQHIDTDLADQTDRAEVVRTLIDIKNKRIGPTTPREERDSITAAYDTVIGNLKNNVSVAPAQMIQTLRKEINVRLKAMANQIAPAQIMDPAANR